MLNVRVESRQAPWPVGRVPRLNPNLGTVWESAGAGITQVWAGGGFWAGEEAKEH